MSRSWSRLVRRLRVGRLVWMLLAALPVLGAWWLWRSESQGGGSPLLAKVLVGLGAAVVALLLGSLLFALTERAPEGRLRSFLAVVVTVVIVGSGIGLYGAVVDWAERQTSPVVDTLGAVCRGGAAPESKPVTGEGPFHAVVVGADGTEVPWSERDASWRAESVEDTELVACIEMREPTVETCYYASPRRPASQKPVHRNRSVVEVWVYAGHSGRRVDHFTLRNEPEPCPQEVADDVEQLIDPVTFEELSARIADLTRP